MLILGMLLFIMWILVNCEVLLCIGCFLKYLLLFSVELNLRELEGGLLLKFEMFCVVSFDGDRWLFLKVDVCKCFNVFEVWLFLVVLSEEEGEFNLNWVGIEDG